VLVAVSPARDSASAVTTANVSASFDRAMDASTIDATTFVVAGPSGDLTGAVRYDTDTDTAIFDPVSELEVGESYTASIAKTVRDTLGQTLDADVIWPFRTGGHIVRVSVNADGLEADGCSFDPSVSEGGGVITFESLASNLVDGDAAGLLDVMRKDTQTGDVMFVTTDETGAPADSAASSSPPCSPITGASPFPTRFNADLSADGRYVAFQSNDPDLIVDGGNGFTHVFVKDTQTGALTLASADATGLQGNGDSNNPSISSDGRFVAFDSAADNLVPGDTLGINDVFVKLVGTDEIIRVSVAEDGLTQGDAASLNASISADGRYVGFESEASNLVLNDANGLRDVFRAFNGFF
jgi:hypothetical protein